MYQFLLLDLRSFSRPSLPTKSCIIHHSFITNALKQDSSWETSSRWAVQEPPPPTLYLAQRLTNVLIKARNRNLSRTAVYAKIYEAVASFRVFPLKFSPFSSAQLALSGSSSNFIKPFVTLWSPILSYRRPVSSVLAMLQFFKPRNPNLSLQNTAQAFYTKYF